MRYSDFFRNAVELSEYDPETAKKLVREAEQYSSPAVADHLILCAKVWMNYLHECDNALRCLYLNECRLAPQDVRGLLIQTEAYLNIVRDIVSAKRCFEKALAVPGNEEAERIAEFLEKYGIVLRALPDKENERMENDTSMEWFSRMAGTRKKM